MFSRSALKALLDVCMTELSQTNGLRHSSAQFIRKRPSSVLNNYRGFSPMNCIGKLFASIITARLQGYLEATGMIGAKQAGFTKGFGYEDRIFLLSKTVSIFLNPKKRLLFSLIMKRI